MSEHALLIICPYDLNIVLDAWLIVTAWKLFSGSTSSYRLDFRRLPGPVFDPPRREGMSAGSFSRPAAGNRAYSSYICFYLFLSVYVIFQIFDVNVKSAFLLAKDVIPLMEKRGFVDLFVLLLF